MSDDFPGLSFMRIWGTPNILQVRILPSQLLSPLRIVNPAFPHINEAPDSRASLQAPHLPGRPCQWDSYRGVRAEESLFMATRMVNEREGPRGEATRPTQHDIGVEAASELGFENDWRIFSTGKQELDTRYYLIPFWTTRSGYVQRYRCTPRDSRSWLFDASGSRVRVFIASRC